jgi:hypothetical protein
MAQISLKCHNAARNDKSVELKHLETELDKAAAQLWGITSKELAAIQNEVRAEANERLEGAQPED